MVTTPPICHKPPIVDVNNNKPVVVLPVPILKTPQDHLHLYTKGLILKKTTQPSDIILIPRTTALKHIGMYNNVNASTSLCDALDGVESGMHTSNKRGSEKHAIHPQDQNTAVVEHRHAVQQEGHAVCIMLCVKPT